MMRQYHILPAADRDLDYQGIYLAEKASLETAPRFYEAARATFEQIARTPGLGEPRGSDNPRLAALRIYRIQGFAKHLVVYRWVGEEIVIVRFLHGARDIDRILDREAGDQEGPA